MTAIVLSITICYLTEFTSFCMIKCMIIFVSILGRRDPHSVEEFLREAVVMRQLDHPHVLSLVGVSVHEDKPCVLLPLMSNGDLKTYLTHHHEVSLVTGRMKCGQMIFDFPSPNYFLICHHDHRSLICRN